MKRFELISAALALVALSPVAAMDLAIENIDLNDELNVTVWEGDVRIVPGSDDTVRVSYDCTGTPATVNADGLRVISDDQSLPELRRGNRSVNFTAAQAAGSCSVEVTAPPTMMARVRINDRGPIEVSDWRARFTAWSAGGDVTLASHAAPFSVTAMNGNATVDFVGDTLTDDSAATAANGLLELRMPQRPALTLRAQARWGQVATDMDIDVRREQVDKATWTVADVSGGGAIVTLRNLNEDIRILGNGSS
ncbi:MAG: hypothetical protein AAGJ52_08535 [Pseudomonadota bacterium]